MELWEYGLVSDAQRVFEASPIECFSNLLLVCALMGSGKLCRSIHRHVVEMGFQWNLHVGNELMGMYGKIGIMDSARKVFDRMAVRSCVSWNTMILGYALNYDCHGASEMFQMMGFY
ncbi:hypothetical protein PVL29_019457 [Vitis rotundifolia]|uniref:Pentatricopeptide repeat-containing protein n=1 Tax=Vitis rotundifolia TaxID=103349 RepID=A0AA39DDW7_VITRO|nr:hypothetical protein PVL29_019457 [Vitis rotundifolia]